MAKKDDCKSAFVQAWWEHWPYFKLSFAIFMLGGIFGTGLVLIGVDLFDLLGFEELEEITPDELTTFAILLNNTIVFFLALLGVFSFGLLTVAILVLNGSLVGYVVPPAVEEAGIGFVLLALIPHGILELPAFFVAAAVSFRLLHRFSHRVRGHRDRLLDPGEGRRIALLLLVTWLVLAVAAAIEVHITFRLVELFYSEQLGMIG